MFEKIFNKVTNIIGALCVPLVFVMAWLEKENVLNKWVAIAIVLFSFVCFLKIFGEHQSQISK